MTPYLELTGLRRQHSSNQPPAVNHLTLNASRGEVVALLGPSGSGKTTVLRLVAGLDEPDAGSVSVAGRDLRGVAPERRGIALMFQRPLLFPHLSVLDNIAFAPRMAGVSRREARVKAARFLELVQLDDYGDRSVRTLSGGQEQRVALARALAAEPDVLLLDEPFSALDPSLRADMHQLLAEVRAVIEPTILMVTHDQTEATIVADSIALLVDGHLEQHDTPDRLYTQPASLVVSRFLGGANEFRGVVSAGIHISDIGHLPVPDATDGSAVLVIRQEAVFLTSPTDSRADAVGEVLSVESAGPRRTVTVRCDGVPVVAEVGPAQSARVGDAVGVLLPFSQRHVVPVPMSPTQVPATR